MLVPRSRAPCPLATCLSSGRDRLALHSGATLSRLERLACRSLCCNCRATSSFALSFSCKCCTSRLNSETIEASCWLCFYLHCAHDELLMPHRSGSLATLRDSGLVSGPWRILRLHPADRAWDQIFYLYKGVLASSHTDSTTAEMCEVSCASAVRCSFFRHSSINKLLTQFEVSSYRPCLQPAALQFILFTLASLSRR